MTIDEYNNKILNDAKSKESITNEYYKSKSKSSQDFYDFIHKHKKALQDAFKDNQKELNLITLIPSLSENYAMSSGERKTKNRDMQYHPKLKGAKIPEPPRLIKDVREQYNPVVSKMDEEESKRELVSEGYYNPSEEDVKAHLEKRKEEQERTNRADEWESLSPLAKLVFSFAAPRISESWQEGRKPSLKDLGLDVTEAIATSVGPGAILKGARAIKPLSKGLAKLGNFLRKYKSTGIDSANPIMGTVGQLAESAGTVGIPEGLIELGLNTTDKALYSGDRTRGTDEWSLSDVKDVFGESARGAMLAGIGSGAKAKRGIDPTAQAKLNKLNEIENLAYPSQKMNVELDKKLYDDIKELKKYDSYLNPEAKVSEKEMKELKEFLTSTNAQNLIKDYAKRNNVDVKTAYDVVKRQADELIKQDKQSKFIELSDWAKLPRDQSVLAKEEKKKLLDQLFLDDMGKGATFGGMLDMGLTRGNNTIDINDKDTGY